MKATSAFLRKHLSILVLLSAALIALANYLIYPTFIRKELDLSEVMIAAGDIPAGTLISREMIKSILTARKNLPEGILFEKEDVLGKYVRQNSRVPENGFFYASLLADKKEAMGSVYSLLQKEETAYTIQLPKRNSYRGQFVSGEHIDLYFQQTLSSFTEKSIVTGILDSHVRILTVNEGSDIVELTLAIKQEDVAYYILAEESGTILPALNWQSGQERAEDASVYSESMLREWLESGNQIVRELQIEEP